MWNSITEAKRAAYISRSEKARALGFKTILDYAYEGIIAIDSENRITVFNSMSEKTLGISGKDIIGKKIDEILPKSKLVDLLCSKGEYLNEIVKYNGMQLAINKVPLIMSSKNIGNVMNFQNVTKVQEMESTIRQKIYTRGHIAKYRFDDIIGKSKSIKEVINTAKGFSQVDANILIMGETGTGKELFAQSIHNHSKRKDGPFVAINCAALPESLLESELFGYVEGAFTGAVKGGKPGLFELAHNGTIFLDEISEISLKIQGRLLRVIQEKEIMRLGHDRIIPVDVRIISATNKNLFALSKKGDFREDLYYRLDILKINLPNINERKEDIPILAESFIRKYGMKLKNEKMTITSRARKLLQSYDWTGNVRELINICERLVVMAQEAVIDKSEVEAVLLNHNTGKVFDESTSISHNLEHSHSDELKNFEKERIKAVLEEVGHSKVKASEKLGISTTTLWRKIKQYKL
jgi:PAS domain S-box-containing protein